MRTLRALIADDESLGRARLARLLGQEDGIEIVAACSNGRQALNALRSSQPDIAFLDIQMPDLNGFRIVDQLVPRQKIHIVFVTAHAEHAVRAFEADAADYLLKPVSADRLHAAIARVRLRMQQPAPVADMSAIRPSTAVDRYVDRLTVPVGRHMRVIDIADIEYAVAQANYVELHVHDRSYLVRSTIGQLMARLDPRRFMRIHRSRIVRLDAIESLERRGLGQYLLHMKQGARLLSGRSYRNELRQALLLGSRNVSG